MKPILLYDGNCNFCIRAIKILEIINKNKIRLLPLQQAGSLKKKFGLINTDLKTKIHFISIEGQVYDGSEAIAELTKYFPQITIFTFLFKTNLGRKAYNFFSKNRYKIFGCSNTCYISKYS